MHAGEHDFFFCRVPTDPQNGPSCDIGWVMENAANALAKFGGCPIESSPGVRLAAWLATCSRCNVYCSRDHDAREAELLPVLVEAPSSSCCVHAGVVTETCKPYNPDSGTQTCPTAACNNVPPGKFSTVNFTTTVVRGAPRPPLPDDDAAAPPQQGPALHCRAKWAPADAQLPGPRPDPRRSCSSTSCSTAQSPPPSW